MMACSIKEIYRNFQFLKAQILLDTAIMAVEKVFFFFLRLKENFITQNGFNLGI